MSKNRRRPGLCNINVAREGGGEAEASNGIHVAEWLCITWHVKSRFLNGSQEAEFELFHLLIQPPPFS